MKDSEVLRPFVHRAISALTDAVVAQLQRLIDDGKVTVRGTPGL